MSAKHSVLTLLFGLFLAAAVDAAPIVLGVTGRVYATAENAMEIAFDNEGYLYAGRNRNGYVNLYRVPPGGGAAHFWGSRWMIDPDGVAVSGEYVYSAGHRDVYRTHRATGFTEVWADYSTNRNMAAIAVDDRGDYGSPGDVIIANARRRNDVETIDATTREATTLVSSRNLRIPRSLQFVAGQLYCVEERAAPGVWRIGPDGALSFVDDGGFPWEFPRAMRYDPLRDAFLVGDADRGEIVSVARYGGATDVVGWGFDDLSGLAFDQRGWLYATDQENDVIWQFRIPEPSGLAVGLITLAMSIVVIVGKRPSICPADRRHA